MATIGKCLLFYLKHPAEMERLYEAEEPNVEGLPDPDRLLERVRLVGDAACKEAAKVLESCALRIEERFRAISAVERVQNKLEDTWELRVRIAPKKARTRRFEVGAMIDSYRAALIPWVWCRGGRRVEDEVIRILEGRTHGFKAATALGLDWYSGTVLLAELPIPRPESLEASVECETLVDQVQKAFAPFTAEHVAEIARIQNSR